MTGARDITRLCFSSNLAGIVANKIKQSFYSVYSYSGIESIKHALSEYENTCKPQYACQEHVSHLSIREVSHSQSDTNSERSVCWEQGSFRRF